MDNKKILYLSYFALGLSIFLGWAYGQLFDTTSSNFRSVEILALLFGGAGFFGIAGEAARVYPRSRLQYIRSNAEGCLSVLKFTANVLPKAICMKLDPLDYVGNSTENSQREHDAACAWAKAEAAKITVLKTDALPIYQRANVEPLPAEIEDEYIRTIYNELLESVDDYHEANEIYIHSKKLMNPSLVETLFSLLSPFLVSIAIGLALYKALYG